MNSAHKWTSLLMAFFLAVTTSVCHSEFQVRSLSNLGIPIPDNDADGVTVPFDFRDVPGDVSYIAVSFDGDGPCIASNSSPGCVGVNHNFISDLRATLIAPNGTEVEIFSNPTDGFGGKNLCDTVFGRIQGGNQITAATFEDSPFNDFYDMSGPIEDIYSIPADGVWFLRIADVSSQDSGSLQSVSLFLETGQTILGNLPPTASIANPVKANEFDGLEISFDGIAADYEEELVSVEYALTTESNPDFVWQEATNVSGDWTQWTFTTNFIENEMYTVSVRSLDAEGNYSIPATRDGLAIQTLDNPPVLTVLNPPTEATQTIGPNVATFPFELSATAQGNNTISGFEYREAFGTFTFVQANEFEEMTVNQTLDLTLNVPQNTSKSFEFRAVDDRGAISDIVTRTLFRSETNTRPNVVILNPASDRFLPVGTQSFNFNGTASDTDGIVDLVEFRVVYPETTFNDMTFENITDWMTANDTSSGVIPYSTWNFTATDLEEGIQDVEVRAIDSEMTASATRSRRLTIDPNVNERPVVSITSPEDSTIFGNDVEFALISGNVLVTQVGIDTLTYDLLTPSGLITNQPITETNNEKTIFNFQIPLEVGQTIVSVRATNQIGNTNTLNSFSQITLVREGTEITNPRISVTFPALSVQSVPNNTTQIMVSGRTTPGSFAIRDVQYQLGTDINNLSAPALVESVKNNYEEWTVTVPLQLYANFVRVTAFDVEGNQSSTITRTIQRFPITPTLTITDPVSDLEIAADVNEVPFAGTTVDPDGGITSVQYRVTTDSQFNNDKSFEKTITSPWLNAIDTSEEGQPAWSSFTFNAPVGNGTNLVEVRGQNSTVGELVRQSRTITQILSDFYLLY